MIPKSYVYKVSRAGVFLGVLQNVVSEFGFTQEINSAGAQLSVSVALTSDTSSQTVEALLDETGAVVQDESSVTIYEDRRPDQVGNSNEGILIRNGNKVDVYEYSTYHPNGTIMFTGLINRWEARFSGENMDEIVSFVVYSDGVELDNYIIQDGI